MGKEYIDGQAVKHSAKICLMYNSVTNGRL